MKVNLKIDAEPNEIIELLFGLSGHRSSAPDENSAYSFMGSIKLSPEDRDLKRGLYRAQMAQGIKPVPPMRGLKWEDFFDPHELNEDGPIIELFVTDAEIARNKKKLAAKRLAHKNP